MGPGSDPFIFEAYWVYADSQIKNVSFILFYFLFNFASFILIRALAISFHLVSHPGNVSWTVCELERPFFKCLIFILIT